VHSWEAAPTCFLFIASAEVKRMEFPTNRPSGAALLITPQPANSVGTQPDAVNSVRMAPVGWPTRAHA